MLLENHLNDTGPALSGGSGISASLLVAKSLRQHQALHWDFLVSSGSSCGHTGSRGRMLSTSLVLQSVTTHSEMMSLPIAVFSYFKGVGKKGDHAVSLACREHVLPRLPAWGAKLPPSNKGKHRRLITTQSEIAFRPAFCRALLMLWTNHIIAPKIKIKEQLCIHM